MKKDVIYIDIEDDITAIIDKVKNASAAIVALVPPKRVGVLQSTVNLKLLQRAADAVDRRIVLITNDQALVGLAAGLSIPIAKNLQSRPEIASIPALEADNEDVINGEELPIGDLAATAPLPDAVDDIAAVPSGNVPSRTDATNAPKKAKASGVKIPNFDGFRKKLFIFGGLGVLLIGFFVWAIFFAPAASVAITARTNVINISKTLQLRADATVDANQGVLPLVTQKTKKTVSVEFTATGKKNIGEKAAGTVSMTACIASTSAPASVPSGTTLTAGGNTYVTTANADFSLESFGNGCINYSTDDTDIAASKAGTSSNVTNATFAVSGRSNIVAQGSTSGGTDKTVTVVSADDVSKAKEELKSQDANTVKEELKKLFTAQQIVIEEGFIVSSADPVSTPAVDSEATTAELTAETTYTLVGVERAGLKAVYDAYLTTQLKGDTSQKVYESGDNATQFSQFIKTDDGFSVRATAVAQVGPNINSDELAEQLKGKRVGEVQQIVEAVQGVKNVDVRLSPFWVSRVPNSADRITITFALENE